MLRTTAAIVFDNSKSEFLQVLIRALIISTLFRHYTIVINKQVPLNYRVKVKLVPYYCRVLETKQPITLSTRSGLNTYISWCWCGG